MNKFSKYFYISAVYIFLYLPIITVVIFSFNNAKHSLVWQGFTLKWYDILFRDGILINVAWHSLVLGILAATIATIIGFIAAVSIFRYHFFGKKILHVIIFILILTPEIMIAISLLLLYNFIKIPLGFWTLLLSHTTMCIPFVTITVYSRMTTIDTTIFEAAMDLGASDFTIFRKVIIPLVSPAIIASWLLSFTLSLDDVIISYFVSGPTFDILPLKIYSMVRLGVKPEVNALCTLMLAFTLLGVTVSYGVLKKKLK
ncbi:MAG: spermidine/putrescine ABC transporter permease PotC [Coxiellaceae bacterium]|jgi:spermidine/putrescine transport system permease protein|nr:spermidine/putrescine ABC transporter permease PotC [Coxiellaceae bacterium]